MVVERLAYQGVAKITGSASGATPNAMDKMANPIRTMEANTTRPISDDFRAPAGLYTVDPSSLGAML